MTAELPAQTSGLGGEMRAKLLQRFTQRKADDSGPRPSVRKPTDIVTPEMTQELRMARNIAEALKIESPFFRVHDGVAGAETSIGGKAYINFASYNYLGLNGHPRIATAVEAAVRHWGSSVSASRIVSGERQIHQDLEHAIAESIGVEDCLTFVSGHATNVTVIGHLYGEGDLILHDALSHNSIVQGALLSRARRISFPHNDFAAAGKLLAEHRRRHRRTLLIIEGQYSMDGDVPDLPGFIAVAQAHGAALMVDEAHSFGVIGARGFGIAEHSGATPTDVDIWMGTLSKSLCGCGGYIAGRREVIDYLRHTAPGFVYSVGLPPVLAAASLAALDVMREEPERVARLNANTRHFRDGLRAAGFDTGLSEGYAIVPLITGSSIMAVRLSEAAFARGLNVQPILYPAVPERAARLRFFLSCDHTDEQLDSAVAILAEEHERLKADKIDLGSLMARVALGGL